MALATAIKINGVNHLTDARYCAGMHVDMLGFCLEETSPRYLSPAFFREITGWISGIDLVAEFSTSKASTIQEAIKLYPGITHVECEELESLLPLKGKDLGLIYKTSIDRLMHQQELFEKLKDQNITLHFTSQYNILNIDYQNFILNASLYSSIYLGFGINAENAKELSQMPGVSGLALDAGDEIKPGLRDFEQLADILESLEQE
jgi:phosphoribosylanthranilate isomerase